MISLSEGASPININVRYPFAALVGQDKMRLALLLVLVDPQLGGVLLRGEKGTAKSTAVRSLVDLLGSERTPFVDLPLGATEDRVLGHLDLEQAIQEGRAIWTPGLLARAHQGILYIDEVNLLDDHLVECLLDCCESGVNRVEREGFSHSHASRFTLIGTMNPEEGDLRPQLLDRFALAVAITGEQETNQRCELLRRHELFEADPATFQRVYFAKTARLHARLQTARNLLPRIILPQHLLAFIIEIAVTNHVQGHRADLAIARAAIAHAAWNGRLAVNAEDITAVAPFALLHRMRHATEPEIPPPPPTPPNENETEQENESAASPSQTPEIQRSMPSPSPETSVDLQNDGDRDDNLQRKENAAASEEHEESETIHAVGSPYRIKALSQQMDRQLRSGSGRRSRTRSATRQGRYICSTPRRLRNDLAFDATLRAAAPYQRVRRMERDSRLAVIIDSQDIRERVRERKVGNLLLFVVDASGSMGAQQRMVETKTAILSLLLDAYQKRDRVGLIVFRGESAQLVLPPTPSVEQAARLLRTLPVGGRTPLGSGLAETDRVLTQVLRRDPHVLPLVLLLTDGRANVAFQNNNPAPHREAQILAARVAERHPQTRFVVIDTEEPGRMRMGLAGQLATAFKAPCLPTENLRANDLVRIVKQAQL